MNELKETNGQTTLLDKISVITRMAGSLSGNISFTASAVQDRGIAETIGIWRDYAENIYDKSTHIERELEAEAERKNNLKDLLDKLDGLHTKIICLADSLGTVEQLSLGTKEVWAKYASDIHEDLEKIMNKHF